MQKAIEEIKAIRREALVMKRQAGDIAKKCERVLSGLVHVTREEITLPDKWQVEIGQVVELLNITCGTKFSAENVDTASLIALRLEEGHTVEEFRRVIMVCNAAWGHEPKMRIYLRPSTLFGDRFEDYLQAAGETSFSRWDDLERMAILKGGEGNERCV